MLLEQVMTQGNVPEKQPDRNPIDYQSPQLTAKAPLGTAVAGAFFGILSVLAAVPLAFMLSDGTRLPVLVGAPIILAAFFALLLLARSAFGKSLPIEQRQRRRRFYIVGFLIGCGIGGLLEGLCFSALSKI
jgi:hypothetical protein